MLQKKESDTSERELTISRLLDAPVTLVWEVWTKPEHIKNWWGPDGFTNTIHSMPFEEGGEWKLTMHGPDGTNYPNRSTFKEIIPFEKIVFEHFNPHFITTVVFEPLGKKTQLHWKMLFDSAEMLATIAKAHKADEGQKQNVAKLEVYLQKTFIPFIIERTYNAPVEKVWQAITDVNAMKQWYFDLAAFKPEVGFEFEFSGKGKEGEDYVHLCKVIEAEREKKLTYSWQYDGYTGVSYVTFELFAEENKTRLILTHIGLETFPAIATNAFAKENFAEGWNYLIGTGLKNFVEQQ